MTTDHRPLLRAMFDAAVAAAQPVLCLPQFLPPKPKGRTVVIGAGKASAAMARAFEDHWDGAIDQSLVVTRYGYEVACERIEIVQAAHPVPDAAGLQASQRIQQLVSGLTADDLVIALISGGGSSLLCAPGPGLTLADKQSINTALLKSGATISEMNCVRRHLSALKGGRLAAACFPARVVTLLISDVPGDRPQDIASGPTVADPTTCAEALAILQRYRIDVPAAVRTLLNSAEGETLKPGDARLANTETHLITTPQIALEAAARVAREAGFVPHILGDSLEGEARDLGLALAGIARQVATRGQPFEAPCVLLSGGETTVTIQGNGRGGRNVECLLSMAVALGGLAGVHALAGDTDGVDGAEEVAGAFITPDTLARAWALGISPRASLDNNDGHGFFQALGDAVITGPTLTNVNDFRAIVIDGFKPHPRYPDPAVQILDPSFTKYRIYSSTVEQLATGMRWAEGPVYFPEGGYLLVSDIPNNRIMKFDERDGSFTVFRANANYANGNTRDRQGRLVTCEHSVTRRITRTEHDGSIAVLADRFEGKRLNAPNDIVVKSDDSIWFTDPLFGINGEWEGARAKPEQATTNVYRIGSDGTISAVLTELVNPNGLAFSPDEKKLYVVECKGTPNRSIWRYDVGADGVSLSNKTKLIDAADQGALDGFRVDRDGNLWCGWGSNGALDAEPTELNGRKVYLPKGKPEDLDGVRVFSPLGKPLAHIRLPERCANLCFGGPKNNRLYMASCHSLYALYVESHGAT